MRTTKSDLLPAHVPVSLVLVWTLLFRPISEKDQTQTSSLKCKNFGVFHVLIQAIPFESIQNVSLFYRQGKHPLNWLLCSPIPINTKKAQDVCVYACLSVYVSSQPAELCTLYRISEPTDQILSFCWVLYFWCTE